MKTLPTALTLIALAVSSVYGQSNSSRYINDNIVQQWVSLPASGILRGQIDVPTIGGSSMVLKEGQITLRPLDGRQRQIIRGRVAKDGTFRLPKVSWGTYALSVRGPNTVASYPIHVLPSGSSSISSNLQVVGSSMSPSLLNRVRRSYLPVRSTSSTTRRFESDPRGAGGRSNQRISLGPGGILTGQVGPAATASEQSAMQGLNVFLTNADEIIRRALVHEDGSFSMSNLSPGAYGIVIAGRTGFAVTGVELIGADISQSEGEADVFRFVSHTVPGANFNLEYNPPSASEDLETSGNEDEQESEGSEDSGQGGSSFGSSNAGGGTPTSGGGGGGSGLPIGDLVGAAGLAAGLSAIGDNDNSNAIASPAAP